MRSTHSLLVAACLASLLGGSALIVLSAQPNKDNSQGKRPRDAVQDAQTPQPSKRERVEQKQNEHDKSGIFAANKAEKSSPAFNDQPDKGEILGFDFYRDPLN